MKDETVEFYVNNFAYIKSLDDADINFIPAIARRRLYKIDKAVLSVLKKVFTDDVKNIVFSSRFGEDERLVKLISQYQEDKEVSPNLFSGSVHNYPVGFFLMNEKKSISYNAVSSGENSISSGLLAAAISACDDAVFCYSDTNDDNIMSLAIYISKNPKIGSKKFKIKWMENSQQTDNFEDFVELFEGKKTCVDTYLYRIERAANEN